MSMQFADLATQISADHTISPDELRALRGAAWMDGIIGEPEAAALFVINDHVENPGPEWVDFFVEALSVWLVEQQSPRGYVDDAQAQWLMQRIAADGTLGSMAEMELLVRCFEKAVSTPRAFKEFALQEMERAIISGFGPTRDGGSLSPDGITASEARLLRRLIFSPGSERPGAVSQAEAEMLFRIKDATLDQTHAAEWKQLFVQGVGNYLQGFGGSEPLSLERERALESFMATPSQGLGKFFGKMGAAGVVTGFGDLMRHRKAARDLDTEIFEARRVAQGEQGWLDQQVNRDGGTDLYEQALLAFLAEE